MLFTADIKTYSEIGDDATNLRFHLYLKFTYTLRINFLKKINRNKRWNYQKYFTSLKVYLPEKMTYQKSRFPGLLVLFYVKFVFHLLGYIDQLWLFECPEIDWWFIQFKTKKIHNIFIKKSQYKLFTYYMSRDWNRESHRNCQTWKWNFNRYFISKPLNLF